VKDNSPSAPPSEPGATSPQQPRVAVIFERFGPYHHARLNAAGQRLPVWGIETCAEEDTYAWDKIQGAISFTRVTLTERQNTTREWKLELHKKMWKTLHDLKPHVVAVPGWSSLDAISALAWCVKTHTPAVVMSESTAWDEHRSAWKEWIKSRLVKLCAAGLAGGTPHAAYLAQLGLPREKTFPGYDVVDNAYFSSRADFVRGQAAATREMHLLPEKFFLASARFIEKKNLNSLIQAYACYHDSARKSEHSEIWDLVLLGDGPLKPQITALVSKLGLQSRVHLPGFKQYQELPAYYGLAQVFVHASTTEQWGLVVNEAMAAGLPVLVSDRCGCAKDLVRDNTNGFAFAPDNESELARLMLKMSAKDFPLAKFGAASRRIIANWGPEKFAGGLHDAVAVALNTSHRPVGVIDRLLLKLLLRR
jgi:glycosyltransferase involved in cell wall biosynthesis